MYIYSPLTPLVTLLLAKCPYPTVMDLFIWPLSLIPVTILLCFDPSVPDKEHVYALSFVLYHHLLVSVNSVYPFLNSCSISLHLNLSDCPISYCNLYWYTNLHCLLK